MTRHGRRLGALAALTVAVTACASASNGGTTPPAGASFAPTAPATTVAPPVATPGASSSGASTTPSYGPAAVDFVITGYRSAEAHGTAGCDALNGAGGVRVFSWRAGEHDYPTLYDGMIIGEALASGGNTLTIKWVVRGAITYQNASPIPYAGDGHAVTLDSDLSGMDGTVHIKGTITCP